ncbi:MAG TPA: aminotransferase class IV [Methylomirabilota bacterium]|nr:aminotransferase class IV [Methylomirabilota bacterium]
MILVDGVVHEGRIARFDYGDRGLTLGDGLFETMIVFAGVVYRLADHLDRLAAGLAILGFAVERERLEADVAAMAARAPVDGGVLRLTVTRGPGVRGLAPPDDPTPTVLVSLAPLDSGLMMQPVRLAVSSIRRNDRSPLSRLKSLGYLDNVLAITEARARGAGDALILNTAERVACASAANVFRIAGDRLETPPIVDGVLPGIVRARVLALAPDAGLAPVERSLTERDLEEADAVFLTNSVRLLQPVTEIDGATLPHDGRGRVAALFDLVVADVASETGHDPRGGRPAA